MKRFFVWVMVVCMLMTMGMMNITAIAEGTENEGMVYLMNPEGWPKMHWAYMSDEEVASYEGAGWVRDTGVLWMYFDGMSWTYDPSVQLPQDTEVQELYNDGYTCNVFYTWLRPNVNGHEQSVTVGQWVLSPELAAEYMNTFVIPEFKMLKTAYETYDSEWYYNGVSAALTGNENEKQLEKFSFVRFIYQTFDYGFGSKLYLRNGDAKVYTYAEAIEENEKVGFFNEMPAWK